jgi:transposase
VKEVSEAMYVGVDVSKRKCRAAVVDGDGVLVDEFSFSNDFEGIRRFVSRLSEGEENEEDNKPTKQEAARTAQGNS